MTNKLCKLLFLALAACTAHQAGDDTTTPGDDDDTTQPDADPDPQATIAIRDDGFVVQDGIRWTADAAPTITGTVGDPATEIEVRAGAASLGKATVSGTTWTFAVPAGALGSAPTELTFVARIRAGAQVVLAQRYAADTTPPVLGAAASPVRDERTDVVSFAPDGTILDHPHTGATVDLAGGTGCADVFKHAYLMDPGDANPIRWNLTATDDGIGIDPASAMVRIGRADGVFGPWFPTTGTLAGTTTTFTVDALRSGSTGVPFVASTEGKLVVQLSLKDRLGREVQSERCWTNHPLAVPLLANPAQLASGYASALLSNILGSGPFFGLASELVNPGSKGLAVMDFDVFNGTLEPAHVTFSLDRPVLTTRRDYVRRTVKVSTTTLTGSQRINCDVDGCDLPIHPAPISNIGSTLTETPDRFMVRVIRIVEDGTTIEVPCAPCDFANGVFGFELAGKTSAGAPGARYRVMTGVREITHWAPSGAPGDIDAGPFADTQLIPGVVIAGKLLRDYDACTHHVFLGPQLVDFCDQTSSFEDYRALSAAELHLGQLTNHIASAPAPGVPARSLGSLATPRSISGFNYVVTQFNLPPQAP